VKVFCGIDWAEAHHDVALVDADGALVPKRRIDDSADGFAELLAMLADAGDTTTDPIPAVLPNQVPGLAARPREARDPGPGPDHGQLARRKEP
jgi:transposase